VRAKRLPSDAFLALCDAVVARARAFGAQIIINDRADLARMSGASGVHVGQDDVPPGDARKQVGPVAIVGFSTHTLAQVEKAIREPVSYVAVGPVFGTATKNTGYEPLGLAFVRAARERIPAALPVVAIGGITLDTAASVLGAGASQVAVISDLVSRGDPKARVAEYLARLTVRP
jgi:thiamine-phosphate pyrophosphorylase